MPGPSNINVDFCLRRRAGFTLVEMLTVMGIIVLLLVATLPALRGLNQSESRRGAIGNLLGVLDQARMMAISNGLATYVVFACPANASQVNPDLLGRAYAIYQDNDNVSFTPVQKTAWLPLPKGIAFKVQAVTDGAAVPNDCISARFVDATPTAADLSFALSNAALSANTSSGTSVQMPYWKFDSTGTVTEQKYLRLLIFPGSVVASSDKGGQEVPTSQSTNTAGGPSHGQFEEIDMNPATGRAKYIIDPYNNLSNNLSTPSSTTSPSP